MTTDKAIFQDRQDPDSETFHVCTRRKFQVNDPNDPDLEVSAGHSDPARIIRCTYCPAPADTVDHIRPRAFGGGDELSNRTPACRSCNSAKGTLPAELLNATTREVRDWLTARGWAPVVPSRTGKTSSWRSPSPERRHVFYSRAAAIRAAACGTHIANQETRCRPN